MVDSSDMTPTGDIRVFSYKQFCEYAGANCKIFPPAPEEEKKILYLLYRDVGMPASEFLEGSDTFYSSLQDCLKEHAAGESDGETREECWEKMAPEWRQRVQTEGHLFVV